MMSENCWNILAISPTNDEHTIKKAYALKLRDNKPDKNPASFRALREAYEQALNERYWYEEIDTAHTAPESESDITEQLPLAEELPVVASTATPNTDDNQPSLLIARINDDPTSTDLDDNDTNHLDNINLSNKLNDALDAAFNIDTHELVEDSDDSQVNKTKSTEAYLTDTYLTDAYLTENKPILPNSQNQLTQWQQQWQKIASATQQNNPSINTESDISRHSKFNVHDTNTAINHHQTQIDQKLAQCLSEQFQQLPEYPLDTIDDYEQALIIFFNESPSVFLQSYNLANKYFNWQQTINDSINYDYPWYLLNYIDERYQYVTHYDRPINFRKHLANKYPLVYHYWDFDLPYSKEPRRSKFLRKFIWPHYAHAVSQQVDALDTELSIHSSLVEHDNYWRNHPQFLALKKNLSKFGFWQWSDAVNIFLIIFVLYFLTNIKHDSTILALDCLGVAIVLSVTYTYWQVQLSYFAHPEDFNVPRPLYRLWFSISCLLWIVFSIFNLQSTEGQTSLFYWGAHLAGFSTLMALNIKNKVIGLKHTIDLFAILALYNALIYASVEATVKLISTNNFIASEEQIYNQPFLWGVVMLPLIFMSVGKRVRLFAVIADYMHNLIFFGCLLMTWSLVVTGSVLLSSADLYYTNVTFVITIIYMVIMLFKSLNYFNGQAN